MTTVTTDTPALHTYRFQKLVRDEAVSTMQNDGAIVTFRKLDDDAFIAALLSKLAEEHAEAELSRHNKNLLTEELADVQEILHTITDHDDLFTLLNQKGVNMLANQLAWINKVARDSGISTDEINATCIRKQAKRGGFQKRHYVEEIQCPIGSRWDVYCATDPVRYNFFQPQPVNRTTTQQTKHPQTKQLATTT